MLPSPFYRWEKSAWDARVGIWRPPQSCFLFFSGLPTLTVTYTLSFYCTNHRSAMVIGKVSSSGQESPAYVPVSDSEQQEPSLAAAGSDLSCFTVLPSSPPGRVLLCSSSRAGDLWLCYGCTPSLVASLGQTNVLSSLVMHPHHPILSRELDEHWVPILAICQNHWLLTAVYLLEHF